MIGVIPSSNRTYEVMGDFKSSDLVEGKLYYDTRDGRLYYYSTTEKRSNPTTGYFPIWDGTSTYSSKFSNNKFFDKDVKLLSVEHISKSLNNHVAKDIVYRQRRSLSNQILKPLIDDKDNCFTQCIKQLISSMNITIIDLYDMAYPSLTEKVVDSCYYSLNKTNFMRLEKWHVWMRVIFKYKYEIIVSKEDKTLVTYTYPENKFNTGIIKYNINKDDDPLKQIIKILFVMLNVDKKDLNEQSADDYTVNNMITTINSSKPISAQLFARFMRMVDLDYKINIYDNDKLVLSYQE